MRKQIVFVLLIALLTAGSAVLADDNRNTTAETPVTAIGDTIFFGSYEQDNDLSNGKEPIEWIVLDVKDDGNYVLISKYALDCRLYNKSYTYVTWETCTLRKWLNEDFYNAAFSAEEKAKIRTVRIVNEDNPYRGTKGGNDTEDRVWLLSINEAYAYFSDNASRMCVPTMYAAMQGAWQSVNCTVDSMGTCWWWLRSTGIVSVYAAYIFDCGYVYSYGCDVDSDNGSVRPVVVVDLNARITLFGDNTENSGTGTGMRIGDVLFFGSYEQDSDLSNGKEPIEWIVLDVKEDGCCVLISKYALDTTPYNWGPGSATWETCTLRKWLNEDFYNTAFSAEEKEKIRTVKLVNEDNPRWGTNGGNDTEDKVWLLSINEVTDEYSEETAYSYFTNNVSRQCAPTKCAGTEWPLGYYTSEGLHACWWWLRSPGNDPCSAAGISYDGNVSYYGSNVGYDICSVRPAIVVQAY